MSTNERNLDRLRIHVRRSAPKNEQDDGVLVAFCPRQNVNIPIDQCAVCEFCDGLHLDRTERGSFVTCSVMPPEAPIPVVEPPRRMTLDNVAIGKLMTKPAITVTEDVSIDTVMALLLEHGISGVPVVDANGAPVGVVSKTDLLRELQDSGDTPEVEPMVIQTRRGDRIELEPGFHTMRLTRSTVSEIMMPIAFTLPVTAPVSRAAALMAFEGIHRVPVVSEAGEVVGLLSAMDILRWVARGDG